MSRSAGCQGIWLCSPPTVLRFAGELLRVGVWAWAGAGTGASGTRLATRLAAGWRERWRVSAGERMGWYGLVVVVDGERPGRDRGVDGGWGRRLADWDGAGRDFAVLAGGVAAAGGGTSAGTGTGFLAIFAEVLFGAEDDSRGRGAAGWRLVCCSVPPDSCCSCASTEACEAVDFFDGRPLCRFSRLGRPTCFVTTVPVLKLESSASSGSNSCCACWISSTGVGRCSEICSSSTTNGSD